MLKTLLIIGAILAAVVATAAIIVAGHVGANRLFYPCTMHLMDSNCSQIRFSHGFAAIGYTALGLIILSIVTFATQLRSALNWAFLLLLLPVIVYGLYLGLFIVVSNFELTEIPNDVTDPRWMASVRAAQRLENETHKLLFVGLAGVLLAFHWLGLRRFASRLGGSV